MSGVQHLLGKIIETPQEKDAIHVAVAPVTAGERLYPGQHIGFTAGNDAHIAWAREKPIGLVDPFLIAPVQPGQQFWLFLYPGSTAVLRHEWTHPAFRPQTERPEPDRIEAEIWIRNFAKSVETPYETVMDGANRFLLDGDYLIQGGRWEGVYTPDEFWPRYEIVTKTTVPKSARGNFFSCSC